MRASLLFITFLLAIAAFPQDKPTDFLNADFHKARRQALREALPANSVVMFFAAPVRNRANDVNFVYHQDPDFYYFTGYKEPHSVLLVFKDMQKAADGTSYNEILFIQPRDPDRETWTGLRLGIPGATAATGIQHVFNNTEFAGYDPDFSKFTAVLFSAFKNDVRDTTDPADLYSLIEQFKQKSHFPDPAKLAVQREPDKNNLNTTQLSDIMNQLRGVKTQEEIKLLRMAVNISCAGQNEVMKAMKPGMSEREVQGLQEFVFKKYQAEDLGYPSIVGAGNNGCILHYIDNYKPELSSKEMILMDLGAEYHGYTADITRTIPVNGRFSKEQAEIYNLVLKSQEAGMEACKAGASFQKLNEVTRKVINEGLVELGIIEIVTTPNSYYPHGCCHHIGLDVHDRGVRNELQEDMLITIEPGIYIPDGSACDQKYWGIGVRIEDDFLINKAGCELLSSLAPRTTQDIEAMMAQPSALNDFVLPALGDR